MQKLRDDEDLFKYKLIKIHQICMKNYSKDYEMIFGKPLAQLPITNVQINQAENSTSNPISSLEEKKQKQEMDYNLDQAPISNNINDLTHEQTRFLRKRKEVNYQYATQEYQPHSFVNFQTMKKQTFEIEISLDVIFFLTLHSHLSRAEVIGIVGGNYNKDSKVILINKLIPCKNIPTQDDFHNVEMDPLSYLEAQNILNEEGLENLGWYHSHPLFKTTPSQIDSQSHQFLSNQYSDNVYLGLIISPYKTHTKDSLCDIFIFFNQKQEVYRLNYKVLPCNSIKLKELNKLKQLYSDAQMQKNINWGAKWRGKVTYQEKLNSSLLRVLAYNLELGYTEPTIINDPENIPLNINIIKLIEEHFIKFPCSQKL